MRSLPSKEGATDGVKHTYLEEVVRHEGPFPVGPPDP